MHLRFRRVEGQQLLTKWSERDLSLMNVQVFLCGGGSSFDSFAHGSLSLAVTAGAKNLNKFLPSAAFDHFWHTEEIFEEICQCGQVSMYILSIINCASVDGRSINNYSESFPMIDDRRAKNALFLFLMPSLPGHHWWHQPTWEILQPPLHWHGRWLFLAVWHRWCFEKAGSKDGKISLIDPVGEKSEAKGVSCDDC